MYLDPKATKKVSRGEKICRHKNNSKRRCCCLFWIQKKRGEVFELLHMQTVDKMMSRDLSDCQKNAFNNKQFE